MRRKIRNFFKTPKGLVTIILVILMVMAAPGQGVRTVAAGLVTATAAAGLVDALILRARKKVWEFPSGAVLTAMIVAMVLRAQEPGTSLRSHRSPRFSASIFSERDRRTCSIPRRWR